SHSAPLLFGSRRTDGLQFVLFRFGELQGAPLPREGHASLKHNHAKMYSYLENDNLGRLSRGIRRLQQASNALDQLTVGEASDEKTEPHQGGQDCHHTLFAEPKSWGVKTIIGSRRSGHLTKGGHVGSGLRV